MKKYIDIFNKLWEHSENEVVEFKKAETNFDVDRKSVGRERVC